MPDSAPDLTPYDRVRYPSLVFNQTHPERLAVLAKIGGLDPVLPGDARVLEIGGGDCLNSIAFAAAYPTARVWGFDLSSAAIADGQAMVDKGGLGNVELAVENILSAAERYPARSFDYVIAHGVYAWLPDEVREATMALIGHALSDRGVAFLSYNVSAGGHVRRFLREMLLEVLRGVDNPDERLGRAVAWLDHFGTETENDKPLQTALRFYARQLSEKQGSVLLHDELGECYFPQSLRAVAECANNYGLRYFTDATASFDGFHTDPSESMTNEDEPMIAKNQIEDFRFARFFRETLLVRADAPIDRILRAERVKGMLVSTKLRLDDEGALRHEKETVRLSDARLSQAWSDLGANYPARVPVEDIATTPDELRSVLHMFAPKCIGLHLGPPPMCTIVGERPLSSPLVRGQILLGMEEVATLDHGQIRVSQPELRELLLAADGSRTIAEIGEMGIAIPADEVRDALNLAARLGLMIA